MYCWVYTLLYIKIYLRKFYYELSRDAVNESFDSFGGGIIKYMFNISCSHVAERLSDLKKHEARYYLVILIL